MDLNKSFQQRSEVILRAVVINLPRHNERWEWVKKNFESADIQAEQLEAVDARDPSAQAQIDAITATESGLSRSEAACILSHRKAWQWLVDSSDDYIAIFEDDVLVSVDMRELLSRACLQEGMDLVKLEIPIGKTSYRHKSYAPYAGRKLHQLISRAYGAAGYIVSRHCAKRLLEISEKCEQPVDVILFDDGSPIWKEFGVFQVVPAACIQDFFFAQRRNQKELFSSSIEDDRSQAKTIRHAIKRKKRNSIPLKKLSRYIKRVLLGAHPLRSKLHVPLDLSSPSASKHSDICNAALLNYTDDVPPFRRCHHEKAGNCRS